MVSPMAATKRQATTLYLDPRISRAARMKAAATGKSLSDLANEGLVRLLTEDDRDLQAVRRRRKEPVRAYEDFLKELRKDGLL
jgi:hypothetical protein